MSLLSVGSMVLCLAVTGAQELDEDSDSSLEHLHDDQAMLLPVDFPSFPIVSGALHSQVRGRIRVTPRSTGSILRTSVDASWAIADVVQLGADLRVLQYSSSEQSGGAASFGNMWLRLKFKLFGASDGPVAVALFADAGLPTASGLTSRSFVTYRGGFAASGRISIVELGGHVDVEGVLRFDEFSSSLFVMTTGYVAVRLFDVIVPQLAYQAAVTALTGGESGAASNALVPAIQWTPTDTMHVDLAARFDAGGNQLYAGGGSVQLLLGIGGVF